MMRFLIDGNDLGSPLNWRDVRIKYKRDEVVRGLFTTFSSEMQFTGAAYAYLKTLWDAKTCDTATLQIQQRSGVFSAWNTILDGVIMLDDAKIDRQMCLISCSAEQSGCNGIFAKNIDKEVDIGAAGDAVLGTLWKEVQGTFDSFYNTTSGGGGPINYTPPVSGAYGKNALLIFNQISEYITGLGGFTNQCLPVVSNFLSQDIVHNSWQMEFIAAPNLGDSIILSWDDDLGNHHEVKYPNPGGSTGLYAYNFMQSMLHWKGVDVPPYPLANPRWRKGEVANAILTPLTNHLLDFVIYREVFNMTLTVPSGNVTLTQINRHQAGAKTCVFVPSAFDDGTKWIGISNGGFNYGQLFPGVLKMSFRKFFDICSKIWNLGMQIEPDGVGGWQIRIEPIDYFYAPPVSTTFRELVDVEHFTDNNLFAKRWWFGKQDDNENTAINDGNPEATTFPGTTGENSTNTEWWYYAKPDCEVEMDNRFDTSIIPALGLTFYDDMLLGLIKNEGYMYMINVNVWVDGPSSMSAYPHHYQVFGNNGMPPPGPNGYQYYYYNIREQPQGIYLNMRSIMPEHQIFVNRYIYEFAQTTYVTSVVTIPDGPYWLPYRWKFKRYINFNEWSAISAAIKIGVNETDNPINDVDGWIREIEYRPYDGYTSFEIEAKK